jgi:hypothetical protein
VHYAWIACPDQSIHSWTAVFSHELVEICTNPEGNAWKAPAYVCGGLGGDCEIADFNKTYDQAGGVWVQSYWSNQDQASVVPA